MQCQIRCSHFNGDVLTKDRLLSDKLEKLFLALVMDRKTAARGSEVFRSKVLRSDVAASGATFACDHSLVFLAQRTS